MEGSGILCELIKKWNEGLLKKSEGGGRNSGGSHSSLGIWQLQCWSLEQNKSMENMMEGKDCDEVSSVLKFRWQVLVIRPESQENNN